MFGNLKIYALIGLAFIASLFGIYLKGGQSERNKAKTKELQFRLDAIKEKQKEKSDVKKATDEELISGLTRPSDRLR